MSLRSWHYCDVNDFYSPTGGGVRTYHDKKLEFFAQRRDVRYTLVVPSSEDSVEDRGTTRVIRLRAPRLPGAPNYRLLLSPGKLRRVFAEAPPDFIEVGSCYSTPWVVAAATRAFDPVTTGFWHADFPHALFERVLEPISPRLASWAASAAWAYARFTYRRFAHTFAASEYAIRSLTENRIGPVSLHPLGVDLERFRPDRRSPELRESVGAERRPLLLFPHRLIDEKGLGVLLAAWPSIYARTGAVLVLMGTGPREAALRKWMSGRDEVHYLGYVSSPERIAGWMATADAVFALSAYETFGLTAAEAMASGTSLIAADRGGVAEHVTGSGAGRLVNARDPKELATATAALLEDDRNEARDKCRSYAVATFSWERTFETMLAVARDLVARKRLGPASDRGAPGNPRSSEPDLHSGFPLQD